MDDEAEINAQLERLRGLYVQAGEDPAVGERAIAGIMESGPGVAERLRVTADAVAAVSGIVEGTT